MIQPPASIEVEMKKFYSTLSEKNKRRYATIEAMKLGRGGQTYISKLLGCSRKTIQRGITELKTLPLDNQYETRIRRPGGGRKAYSQKKYYR